jgi:catalase
MAKRVPSANDTTVRNKNKGTNRGKGGETHQIAGQAVPVLTSQQGIPVSDDQNSLKIGARGPTA